MLSRDYFVFSNYWLGLVPMFPMQTYALDVLNDRNNTLNMFSM